MTEILPTTGRARTNAWYEPYQSLVRTVPDIGTMAGREDLSHTWASDTAQFDCIATGENKRKADGWCEMEGLSGLMTHWGHQSHN